MPFLVQPIRTYPGLSYARYQESGKHNGQEYYEGISLSFQPSESKTSYLFFPTSGQYGSDSTRVSSLLQSPTAVRLFKNAAQIRDNVSRDAIINSALGFETVARNLNIAA